MQELKKKVVVLCSSPQQNHKIGISTSYSCIDGKEMYKKAWCMCKIIVLLIKPIAFLPLSLMSPLPFLKLTINRKPLLRYSISTCGKIFFSEQKNIFSNEIPLPVQSSFASLFLEFLFWNKREGSLLLYPEVRVWSFP